MIEKCVNNILVRISNIFTKVDRRNTLPLTLCKTTFHFNNIRKIMKNAF